MFRFIRHKIFNKKWLNFCLLIGVALLSAFLCVYPMFKEGSLNRMLETLMSDYIETKNVFPATLKTHGTVEGTSYNTSDSILEFMNALEAKWTQYIDTPVVERQRVLEIAPGYSSDSFNGKPRQVFLDYIEGYKENSDLLFGTFPSDASECDNEMVKEALADGAYPCVISSKSADKDNFSVGQHYPITFKNKDEKEITFTVVVCGIIDEKEGSAYFWNSKITSFDRTLFFDKEDYDAILSVYDRTIFYYETVMLDYTYINYRNADEYFSYLNQFSNLDKNFEANFKDTISTYLENKKTISSILITFEIPILALLLLFIYMISGQILEMETGEIAMLKSRGVSRFEVIRLYILQSFVISFAGSVLGIPLGYIFCKLGASTDAFLVFTLKETSIYRPTEMMLAFAGIALVLSMFFMTIPVISISKFTIIERKSKKHYGKSKAIWERFFLDIPLLGLSIYLLFNYSKQREAIAMNVITGSGIDPIMFLDSSLFILGCGLLALRLIKLFIRLIYKLGRNKWKPAEYVAFLQILRSNRKQGFIAVFLVMTIAMGIFNSNLARSVNENMEQRIEYNVGCDYILAERWNIFIKKLGSMGPIYWRYDEPDMKRFDGLKEVGVTQMTRVLRDDNTDVIKDKKVEGKCLLLGINTKEFGEVATLKDGLNDKHWYYYLNDLASDPKGVLISRNLAEKMEYEIGDTLIYGRYSPVDSKNIYADSKATIVGIIDSFPGYESVLYEEQLDGTFKRRENYLVVANYTTVMNAFRLRPYEIWMKMDDSANYKEVTSAIEDLGIKIQGTTIKGKQIESQRNSTLIQITNGMFSIGFLVSLTICAVGFLIYWILTIKDRELIYGIYRSMGLTMGEIFRMLILEQIFSSFFSCIAGFGVGMLTTMLFTKLISIVYLPRAHNLPLEIIFKAQDGLKMIFIVVFVFVVCFSIIYRIIKNMNITKAIKLGED